MIGNDIIDLKVAAINSRWQEQRFLDKLFTDAEQEFILNHSNRFQAIWILWSMKESAYKIYGRYFKSSTFNPKFFDCSVISKNSGIVFFDNQNVNTTSEFKTDVIYTTAQFQKRIQSTKYFVLDGNSHAEKSKQLKECAIRAFADFKSVPEKLISIETTKIGVPQFLINQKAQNNFLTLTHHGNYGGFAISY